MATHLPHPDVHDFENTETRLRTPNESLKTMSD